MARIGMEFFLTLALAMAAQPQRGTAQDTRVDNKVKPAKAQGNPIAAAPGLSLIEGEMVRPEEAMTFTRSVLIEEGPSVAAMNEYQENINTVRYNFNSYRIGYSLPATKVGERFIFSGPVKGWRATSTGDVSVWPPAEYPASRIETMRRTKLLQPIILADPIDEMNNLRVYYFPSLVAHDGRDYRVEPMALAFFIHPKTGYRMTVMSRAGRVYGAVNKPLATTSSIYVQDVTSYPAGPLGLGRARVPSVFYSKTVRFDMEPFASGDNFERLMAQVLEAHTSGPLSTDNFKELYREMLRYTGGVVD
jgi:hypothetical protein